MTAEEKADVIAAALENLELDLNGRDESALEVVAAFVGRELTFAEALALVGAAQ